MRIDELGFAKFMFAASAGDLAALREGLAKNPQWAKQKDSGGGLSALCWAAREGRAECVAELLPVSDLVEAEGARKSGQRAKSRAWPPLVCAIQGGDSECFRLVLAAIRKIGASSIAGRQEQEDALAFASGVGQEACQRDLLASLGAALSPKGASEAFNEALCGGHLSCAQALAPRVDIFSPDTRGDTPLDVAIACESWACADWLASLMSAESRKELRKKAPKSVDFPLCRAVDEQAAIQEEVERAKNERPLDANEPASQAGRHQEKAAGARRI